jgi:ribosomal protein S18 acetylase RimI-like enzyme
MRLYLAKAFGPRVQAAELAAPGSRFLVAEVEGEAAGYARLREGGPAAAALDARHPLELVRIYARKRWIGRGVGAALMRAALAEADTGGHDALWLAVWERNERAIGFYRRFGFEPFGTQEFHLGRDVQTDLLMARPVPAP